MAKHGKVKDSGEYFVINPASRKVTVPHVHKSIGTVGDHNSEQITFECPQMIDGHDISQCESRYVTWINVNGEVGHDELQIAEVEQGKEGMLYLSWTIRNGLTVAKGIVQFSVHFEDFDEDGETLYRWSTATCKDCDILDSVNAVLGAYQAIYVAGDTLVIEDYTLVKDGVLELETNGLVPEGTLKIEANGKFDVGKYAEVDIAVNPVPPEIVIFSNGKVRATANGISSEVMLNENCDLDFIASNIKKGVEIFGTEGTYDPLKLVEGDIYDNTVSASASDMVGVKVWYAGISPRTGEFSYFCNDVFDDIATSEKSKKIKVLKNSMVIVSPYSVNSEKVATGKYYIDCSGEVVEWDSSPDKSFFLLQVGENEFTIKLEEANG